LIEEHFGEKDEEQNEEKKEVKRAPSINETKTEMLTYMKSGEYMIHVFIEEYKHLQLECLDHDDTLVDIIANI
jgi:hypothetical protein